VEGEADDATIDGVEEMNDATASGLEEFGDVTDQVLGVE
jgi:hypothetical protein